MLSKGLPQQASATMPPAFGKVALGRCAQRRGVDELPEILHLMQVRLDADVLQATNVLRGPDQQTVGERVVDGREVDLQSLESSIRRLGGS